MRPPIPNMAETVRDWEPAGGECGPERSAGWRPPSACSSALSASSNARSDLVLCGECRTMVHVVDRAAVANLPAAIRNSAFPITGDHFLAAVTTGEYDGVMMRVNHSCEPNVGMGGNVVLVSMRDIAVGEEVTIDYALFLADPGFPMACRCGAAGCRAMVTGTDWMRPGLQQRYRGWFSWWLQQKISQTRGGPVARDGRPG